MPKIMPKCSYPGCDKVALEWCHASCCCGETAACGREHAHDAQRILDMMGYTSGYFGDHEDDVLGVVDALKRGWGRA
jgi:hypothetical protein